MRVLKQYLTEKQSGYLQSGCLREVVAMRVFKSQVFTVE